MKAEPIWLIPEKLAANLELLIIIILSTVYQTFKLQ